MAWGMATAHLWAAAIMGGHSQRLCPASLAISMGGCGDFLTSKHLLALPPASAR